MFLQAAPFFRVSEPCEIEETTQIQNYRVPKGSLAAQRTMSEVAAPLVNRLCETALDRNAVL